MLVPTPNYCGIPVTPRTRLILVNLLFLSRIFGTKNQMKIRFFIVQNMLSKMGRNRSPRRAHELAIQNNRLSRGYAADQR